MHWVTKCHIFTWIKSFNLNLTPRKEQQIEWISDKWLLLWGTGWTSYQTKTKPHKRWLNLPKYYFILQNYYSCYPNLPLFLHRYICHICDISHLCTPIMVTWRNICMPNPSAEQVFSLQHSLNILIYIWYSYSYRKYWNNQPLEHDRRSKFTGFWNR